MRLLNETMNNKLLNLLRERREYEYRTLEGYKSTGHLMHKLLSDQIEIEMKTIGGQNKTRLRKEAKNNPYLQKLLKRGELRERI